MSKLTQIQLCGRQVTESLVDISTMNERIRYYLKLPNKARKSFAIIKDTVVGSKRSYETLQDERVEAVNRQYKLGKDKTLCTLELKEVIEALYRMHRKPAIFCEDNFYILDKYWDKEYKDRLLVDPKSIYNSLNRAVEALGHHSILTIDRPTLVALINSKYKGNKQRLIAIRLNQLLNFCKRPMQLSLGKKERRVMRYLTESEFRQVLGRIPLPYRTLYSVAFNSGARIGEIFALAEGNLQGDTLFIEAQIDRARVLRDTKTRRVRQTYYLNLFENDFHRFVVTKHLFDRAYDYSRLLKTACQQVFPTNKNKWCSIHCLRHSYAIWLLNKGVSISLVAQSLGNSVLVCQEYYLGYSLNSESIQSIKNIVGPG